MKRPAAVQSKGHSFSFAFPSCEPLFPHTLQPYPCVLLFLESVRRTLEFPHRAHLRRNAIRSDFKGENSLARRVLTHAHNKAGQKGEKKWVFSLFVCSSKNHQPFSRAHAPFFSPRRARAWHVEYIFLSRARRKLHFVSRREIRASKPCPRNVFLLDRNYRAQRGAVNAKMERALLCARRLPLIALESDNNYCHYSLISARRLEFASAKTGKGTPFHLSDRFGWSMTNWNSLFPLCESGFKFLSQKYHS